MKTSSLIIAKILTLCGIVLTCTACYAPGNAEFEVKIKVDGRVTNASDEPVEGIMVTVSVPSEDGYKLGSAETDTEGKYDIQYDGWHMLTAVDVSAEDVDEDENGGSFAAETKTVAIDSSDYKGGSGGWYKGEAVKTADFELEKIIDTPDEE